MDDIAVFVYASGGVVHTTELARFFSKHPDVERELYAAATPIRHLKRIFKHFGAAHGLSWVDADADESSSQWSIVHNLTTAQRDVFPRTIPLRIPQCLNAVEILLRAAPNTRIKHHALSHLSPTDATFMRVRSGSIVQFLQTYDAYGKRFGVSETDVWLVTSTMPSRPTTPLSSSTTTTTSSLEDEVHDIGEEWTLEPLVALQALQVLYTVLAQTRVFRSPFTPSLGVLLVQVVRLVQRSQSSINMIVRPSSVTCHTVLMRPSNPVIVAPAQPPMHLLIPSVPTDLTWIRRSSYA